jgi:NDP-sugar pyrophosphorylase family protein
MVGDLEDTFLVCNGDILTTLALKDLFKFHQQQGGIATIAMHQRKVNINLGVIQTNDGHEITGYLEKPCMDYMVSMGIYIFEPRILDYIEPNCYLDFPDLVLKVLAAGEKVYGFPYDGYWQDLGNPEDYQQAQQDFIEMETQFMVEK